MNLWLNSLIYGYVYLLYASILTSVAIQVSKLGIWRSNMSLVSLDLRQISFKLVLEWLVRVFIVVCACNLYRNLTLIREVINNFGLWDRFLHQLQFEISTIKACLAWNVLTKCYLALGHPWCSLWDRFVKIGLQGWSPFCTVILLLRSFLRTLIVDFVCSCLPKLLLEVIEYVQTCWSFEELPSLS